MQINFYEAITYLTTPDLCIVALSKKTMWLRSSP